jgi:hypothetical protein
MSEEQAPIGRAHRQQQQKQLGTVLGTWDFTKMMASRTILSSTLFVLEQLLERCVALASSTRMMIWIDS